MLLKRQIKYEKCKTKCKSNNNHNAVVARVCVKSVKQCKTNVKLKNPLVAGVLANTVIVVQ